MQRSVRLKSHELVARDINDVDIELLHALSISVGWPHRAKDWELLRRAGHGIVAVDEIAGAERDPCRLSPVCCARLHERGNRLHAPGRGPTNAPSNAGLEW